MAERRIGRLHPHSEPHSRRPSSVRRRTTGAEHFDVVARVRHVGADLDRPALLVSAASLGFLALLGAIGAKAGGSNLTRATARVTFWGAFAIALTAGGLSGNVD